MSLFCKIIARCAPAKRLSTTTRIASCPQKGTPKHFIDSQIIKRFLASGFIPLMPPSNIHTSCICSVARIHQATSTFVHTNSALALRLFHWLTRLLAFLFISSSIIIRERHRRFPNAAPDTPCTLTSASLVSTPDLPPIFDMEKHLRGGSSRIESIHSYSGVYVWQWFVAAVASVRRPSPEPKALDFLRAVPQCRLLALTNVVHGRSHYHRTLLLWASITTLANLLFSLMFCELRGQVLLQIAFARVWETWRIPDLWLSCNV